MSEGAESWRPVPGFADVEASNLGRVRRRGKLMVGSVSRSTGYRRTAINRRETTFHALVAAAFLGVRPDGLVVNHKNCNKLDNRPDNLEYITQGENTKHAWENGRGPSGVRHGRHTKPEKSARGERVNTAKLTATQVREIRELRKEGAKLADIARRFNISVSQASNVASGTQWRHIQ